MSKSKSVAGKTVFITGAARGIGAETARRLHARGANVALIGLEPDALAARCIEFGDRTMYVEADVTDWDALESAVSQTVERFGGIDIAICNAGIACPGFMRNIDPKAFERTIEINLLGQWRTARSVVDELIKSKGQLVVVASASAIFPAPGMAAYTASKAGVEAFTNAVRAELRPHGVSTTCAYFSWIDTDLVRGADQTKSAGFLRAKIPGPAGKTYPLSDAVDAFVDGIEAKRNRFFFPRWLAGASLFRGILVPISALTTRATVKEADKLWEQEIDELGVEAASRPVGAGGRAAISN